MAAQQQRAAGNVVVAAILRPRGLLIGVGGGLISLAVSLLLNWYLLFAGLVMTLGAYGWSVADSLSDEDFIEAMARPALPAAVSDEASLVVSAHRGSRQLTGAYRDQHRELAALASRIIDKTAACPATAQKYIADVPSRVAALVSAFEAMAVEVQELEAAGTNLPRLAALQAELVHLRECLEAVEKRIKGMSAVSLAAITEEADDLRADVTAIESTVGELKLLE